MEDGVMTVPESLSSDSEEGEFDQRLRASRKRWRKGVESKPEDDIFNFHGHTVESQGEARYWGDEGRMVLCMYCCIYLSVDTYNRIFVIAVGVISNVFDYAKRGILKTGEYI